ncbi:Peroxidase 55 [Linum perenne]
MGSTRLCCTMIMTMVVLIAGRASTVVGQQLAENFYAGSCPNVEAVVQQAVRAKARNNLATIPGTLRMFFHDCFVTGCDASVMVATPNGDAEKDAPDNLSLAGDGFDTIIKAKTAVEAVCPGVVSCADIMAMAARDVVSIQAGGPSFKVELGRRDSIVSSASLVAGNLPEPSMTLPQLNAIFWKNNLTQFDMIALSGAHTLGFSHCNRIAKRIYSWSPNSTVDPSLDPTYSKELMKQCKPNANPNIAISIDPTTPSTFDNVYYQNLIGGKGLFTSDQVLYTDSRSKPTVVDFANNAGDFNGAFVMAMRKLGRVGVKTGKQGRIRSECTDINS